MTNVTQFSDEKIFFHNNSLISTLHKQLSTPVEYDISISGICNCHCTYCCCTNYLQPQMLNKTDMDIILNQVHGHAGSIVITGGGEPLTNPNLSYLLEKCSLTSMSIGLVSNGLLLTHKLCDEIVRTCSFFRISLDTVNPLIYHTTRGVRLDTERLSLMMKCLVLQKNVQRRDILLGAQIVLTQQSIQDIEATVLFCKEIGFDFIQIRPVDHLINRVDVHLYKTYNRIKEALHSLEEMYTNSEYNVIINYQKFNEYFSCHVQKDYHHCFGANFTAAIGHDMNLYFCCANIGNPVFSLGNLRDKSIHEILFSDKRRELLDNPPQQHCLIQCRNHKINKLLTDLIALDENTRNILIDGKSTQERPLHYEFL